MPNKIILVRHGETDYNKNHRMQGWLDIPLNTTGIKQASLTAARFTSMQVDVIYSSDLLRAYTTAEHIAKVVQKDIIKVPSLRERDMGIFAGWEWEKESDPNLSQLWQEFEQARDREDLDWNRHHGESLRQMTERIESFMTHLHTHHSGQTVVLVTHGGTINRLLEHFRLKSAYEGFREVKNASLHLLHKNGKNYLHQEL